MSLRWPSERSAIADRLTQVALLAGFTADILAKLERDGFITTSINRVRAGAKTINVKRIRITEDGWKAIEVAAALSAAGGRPAVIVGGARRTKLTRCGSGVCIAASDTSIRQV